MAKINARGDREVARFERSLPDQGDVTERRTILVLTAAGRALWRTSWRYRGKLEGDSYSICVRFGKPASEEAILAAGFVRVRG